jgi:hypothetical protein
VRSRLIPELHKSCSSHHSWSACRTGSWAHPGHCAWAEIYQSDFDTNCQNLTKETAHKLLTRSQPISGGVSPTERNTYCTPKDNLWGLLSWFNPSTTINIRLFQQPFLQNCILHLLISSSGQPEGLNTILTEHCFRNSGILLPVFISGDFFPHLSETCSMIGHWTFDLQPRFFFYLYIRFCSFILLTVLSDYDTSMAMTWWANTFDTSVAVCSIWTVDLAYLLNSFSVNFLSLRRISKFLKIFYVDRSNCKKTMIKWTIYLEKELMLE